MVFSWFKVLGAAPAVTVATSDWDVVGAILSAGPVVKGIMLILLAFSVLSWAIIIAKGRQLRRARREDTEFFRLFWDAPDLAAARQATSHLSFSPAANILKETLATGEANPLARLSDEAPRRTLRRALSKQVSNLSRSLSFLATCGNTAPFIGLLGTVWGIMSAFQSIGAKGSASLATVAPGIAEALIATAAGLAAAIPAVIAYNYFLGQVRRLEAELMDFASDLAPLLSTPGNPDTQR